jgi:hypothetical protein
MKRYTAIKNLLNLLHDNDILIFSGPDICKEAYEYDKPNHFYINDTQGVAASVGLGLAMCTDKRVFTFIGEGELLRDLGILTQLGSSRCENMFLIVLDNACYQAAGGHPSIFDNVISKKGLVYNAGSKVVDFTKHFRDRIFKNLKNRFDTLLGPITILLDVDKGLKKDLPEIEIDYLKQKDRIKELVSNTELKSALFIPPQLIDSEIVSLNLDEISTGGIS